MSGIWMVRAGEGGYLAKEFARGFVAIGFDKLGDMSDVSAQDSIRANFIAAYPDARPNEIGNPVAIFYKFRTVLNVGDTVMTYVPESREYLLGKVASDYYYKPGEVPDYNHVRKVLWEGRVSRDALTATSRNSLGSTLTMFSINDDVWADIQGALSGTPVTSLDDTEEEEKKELQQIKEDNIAKARELIKDKILKLNDREMEHLVAAILRAMGYKTRVTPVGPDRGVDVLASPDGLGLQEPRIKAEVKHRQKTTMGPQDIRSFLGGLRDGNRGLFISTGGFTKEAKYEAERATIPCTLIDLEDLASLVIDNYENFDLEGCTLIPLTKVYWPAE